MEKHNHSQLEELRMSEKELWDKKVGKRNSDSEAGMHTPIGHAYSIILEELAEQNLDSNPNLEEFMRYIKIALRRQGKPHLVDSVQLTSPSYFPYFTDPMITFMKDKGLNPLSCVKIMDDIVGPDFPYYTKRRIEKDFF